MSKILVFGASGMAGHSIALYLAEQGHDVTAAVRQPIEFCNYVEVDIFNTQQIKLKLQAERYDYIVNCIGILNQFADEEKSEAVYVNSFLPHYLADIASKINTKIIHLSTDCVFFGDKGEYTENSFPDGKTFYDRSKALGEIIDDKNLTFRNSIIGPDLKENGIGLFNWFMKQNTTINGYTKAIWSGVTTLTLAKAINFVFKSNITGIYHLTNNHSISKYELLKIFNAEFKANKLEIVPLSNIAVDKSLINTRNDFEFEVPSYQQMILEMKEWIVQHKNLYPHYEVI